MDHPVRLAFVTIAATCAAVVAAQTISPIAEPGSPPVGPAPEVTRSVSPRVAEMLAAAMPKYQGPMASPKRPELAEPNEMEREKPANSIVRLPNYVVRESKLPTPIEVMTRRELENYAMKRYIGPEDGLDRGVLNLFTLAGLWKKIPVLGHFPFAGSETNEDRALRLHDEAERKRKMEELSGLMTLTKMAGDTAGAGKIKQELDKASIRPAETGR